MVRRRVLRMGLILSLVTMAGLFIAPWGGQRLLMRAALAGPLAAPYDWVQFNFDAGHSGNNTQESAISPTNVAGLRLLYQIRLPVVADGAPAYLSGVTTATGARDLLFVTTRPGDLVALDAQTGAQLWA